METFLEKIQIDTEELIHSAWGDSTHVRRILVAEDDPASARVVEEQLKRMGFTVDIARNGVSAVREFRVTNYEAVIMDIQMPEMDGLEATRMIRLMETNGNRTPIIALTARAFDEDRRACFDAGMDAFISKPLKLIDLVSALDSIMLHE